MTLNRLIGWFVRPWDFDRSNRLLCRAAGEIDVCRKEGRKEGRGMHKLGR